MKATAPKRRRAEGIWAAPTKIRRSLEGLLFGRKYLRYIEVAEIMAKQHGYPMSLRGIGEYRKWCVEARNGAPAGEIKPVLNRRRTKAGSIVIEIVAPTGSSVRVLERRGRY